VLTGSEMTFFCGKLLVSSGLLLQRIADNYF
jgi:hypothetical protein